MKKLPKICKCPYCGEKHDLPLYVYAHWANTFTVTCENCNKNFSMYQGKTDEKA